MNRVFTQDVRSLCTPKEIQVKKQQQMEAMIHNPRSMSSDLTSASTCKSDILLLQMHQQKLSRKYIAHQNQEPSSACSLNQQLQQLMKQLGQVVGDQEIQIALSECRDVNAILMRNQYQNEHDAIQKMALRIRLMQLVESQMQQMEHVLVEMMHSCSNSGSFVHPKTSLSRLPTFLTLMDQCADVALKPSMNQSQPQLPPASQPKSQGNNHDDVSHAKFPPIVSSSPTPEPVPVNSGDVKLQQQLEKCRKENQILKHMKKSELRKFQQELLTLQQEKDGWCAKYNQANEELEKRTRERQDLATTNAAVESQMKTLKRQHRDLAQNQKTCQETMEQKSRHCAELEQQLSEEQQLLEASQGQLASLQRELESVQETLRETTARLSQENIRRQGLEQHDGHVQQQLQEWKDLLQVEERMSSDDSSADRQISCAISELQTRYKKQTLTLTCVQQAFETSQDELDRVTKELRQEQQQWQEQRAGLEQREQKIERSVADQVVVWENERRDLEDRLGAQQQNEKQTQYQLQVERDANHTLTLNFKALQQEKRDWMKSKLDTEVESITADTYEEVMKEEFEVMQHAFLQRIEAAEAQVAKQQREAQEERQALLEQHKQERCRFIMQLNTRKK